MKKTTLWIAFMVLIGLVAWGAFNRTASGSETTDPAVVSAEDHTSEAVQTTTDTSGTGDAAAAAEATDTGILDLILGNGDGIPDASENIDEIVSLDGVISYVDEIQMVVDTSDGQVLVESRPWTFLVSLGFSASVGEELRMTGFYEDGVFEVMTIEQVSSGTVFILRDEDGRPMWAGSRG